MSHVMILRGSPSSKKDEFVQNYLKETNHSTLVISFKTLYDNIVLKDYAKTYRIYQLLYSQLSCAIQLDFNVIVNVMSLSLVEVSELKKIAHEYGASVEVVSCGANNEK